MKNPIYNIITFISLINVSKSYIHQGLGHGTHYFSNLREPYMDIIPVSIDYGIKISNEYADNIFKNKNIYNNNHNKNNNFLYKKLDYYGYGETMREINAFEYLVYKNYKNINCLLWKPNPRIYSVSHEPLSLVVYSKNIETKQLQVNNVIFNPIWNNDKIPLMELKYALDSYFEQKYNNEIIDYTEVYTNNKNIKDIWDNYYP